MSKQTELEARFGHLIQPIRDLTRNWDVDIATQLEDYLDEIGTIAITFDGGQTTLNFAEAALLIQGSACVYSKKVEYLHALVYQVLDLLASKKKLQAASVDAEGRDKDVTFANKHDEEEFLSLDDIKDHKNINMKGDQDNSDKNIQVLPRVTLSLLPLEDGEKGDNPLLNHKGEVLGSRNDFKMNTCNIHPTGTLLLDLSHLDLLELSFQNKPTSTPFVPRVAPKLTEAPPGVQEDIQMDEGLPCGDLSMDDNNASFGAPAQDIVDETQPADHAKDVQAGMQLRRSERNKNIISRYAAKPEADPWKMLDAHQEITTDRKFKKKKTFMMMASLESEDNKKRKHKKTTKVTADKKLMPIMEFCTKAFFSRASQFPKNPLKVPTFAEFEHLFWDEFKLRQTKLRQERKRLEEQGRLQDLEEDLEAEAQEDSYHEAADGFDNDDDVVRRVDFQIPEVDDLGPMQPPEIPDPMEEFDHGHGVNDVSIISSYEELVRHHVDNYMTSAQQYAQITELSRRVSEWEEKILPKLQEEEDHGPFDIHRYGSNVLDNLSEKSTTDSDKEHKIQFRRICQNKPNYEVCRLFLASLQLANNYNIEISTEGTLSESIDSMSLKMLSTRRHHQALEDYRAPSIDP